jgi:hypothetical protein
MAMLRRLFVGLVLGLVVGALVAAGIVAGLGIRVFAGAGGAVLAYVAAAVTGVLTGLVAGKPIWASGAKVEAGLKAFFGALIAAGVMFALRQWAGSWTIDLPAIGVNGATAIGDLPAASLPLLAAVLGGFFELDNTRQDEGDDKGAGAAKGRQRVSAGGPQISNARGGGLGKVPEIESDDPAEVASRRAKR